MTRITDSSDSGYGGVTGNSNRGVMNAIDGNCDQESDLILFTFLLTFSVVSIGQVVSPRDQYYQSSSSKGNEKPPQLPPRDVNAIYSQNLPTVRHLMESKN